MRNTALDKTECIHFTDMERRKEEQKAFAACFLMHDRWEKMEERIREGVSRDGIQYFYK